MGEDTRDGISFAVIAKALGMESQKLNELYLLIEAFRKRPDLPPGFEWRIVKTEVDVD